MRTPADRPALFGGLVLAGLMVRIPNHYGVRDNLASKKYVSITRIMLTRVSTGKQCVSRARFLHRQEHLI